MQLSTASFPALAAFRYADGAAPNLAALSLVLIGWPLGMALLTADSGLLNALGFALVTLALVWSGYFIHEFAHQAIFRKPEVNDRWGTAMSWVNGSCYARFAGMRRKHMRHHVERADVMTFDVRSFLLNAPAPVRRLVLALEWAYVPAVELLMRSFVIAQPFQPGGTALNRLRMLSIGLLRGGAWVTLGLYSPKALALYALAYLLFITVLRFADCFQHTYDAYPMQGDAPIPQDKLRDRAYEQANTFSDVVGLDSRWLNLLWLNFGFHNAHHERPTVPWHRLPAYHRALYADGCTQLITVAELLQSFHRHRVTRVLANDYGVVHGHGVALRAAGFVGAVGVSFLTAV